MVIIPGKDGQDLFWTPQLTTHCLLNLEALRGMVSMFFPSRLWEGKAGGWFWLSESSQLEAIPTNNHYMKPPTIIQYAPFLSPGLLILSTKLGLPNSLKIYIFSYIPWKYTMSYRKPHFCAIWQPTFTPFLLRESILWRWTNFRSWAARAGAVVRRSTRGDLPWRLYDLGLLGFPWYLDTLCCNNHGYPLAMMKVPILVCG